MTTMLGATRPSIAGSGHDAFAQFAAAVRRQCGVDEVALLTTMPRGGLQVCRGPAGHEAGGRRYGAELHTQDAAAWDALVHGVSSSPATADVVFGPGLIGVLNVRVESPVFGGFPGVVRLLRLEGGSSAPLPAASTADTVRRLFAEHVKPLAVVASRQFVFVDDRMVLPLQKSDGMSEAASALAAAVGSDHATTTAGRETVPGPDGVRVPVQVVRYDAYPALGKGPVVFVSLHPDVTDWSLLRAEDFSADPEVGRLTAAVTFMAEHFRRSPTLGEVADAVHLSQFHFHRRFSELFGLTPKHLLYDLQLDEAQRMLSDPRQQLSSIAKHCGFAHQSHFTSRFKQGTGLTPTRWRRQAVHHGAAAAEAAAV